MSDLKELNSTEITRYSRHLLLNEVGLIGQRKLKGAKVLLIGAGGLGSPISMYLAAAGVGTIGLVDFDKVEYSNLHRQIIHDTENVGLLKIVSAKKRLEAINPEVEIKLHPIELNSDNAFDVLNGYDIICDGTDNFATRYLVNDACVLLGKTNVFGSIYQFDGQVTVFDSKLGPCYRCLYPKPPNPGEVPSCAEAGVLGILPGIIGLIQATEIIKIIINNGTPLINRLLTFNALDMTFRELKIRKDPNCNLCGKNSTINSLIDYQQFCGVSPTSELSEISPLELYLLRYENIPHQLLDVRTPNEWEISQIEGSTKISLADIYDHDLENLNKELLTVILCKSGVRSKKAISILEEKGFQNLRNLTGGIIAWSKEIDPKLNIY